MKIYCCSRLLPSVIGTLLVCALLPGLLLAAPDPARVYAWYAGDNGLGVGVDRYSVTTWTNLGWGATNGVYSQAGRNLSLLKGSPQETYLRLTNGAAAGAVSFEGAEGIWASKANFGIVSNACTIITCARVREAVAQGFLFDSTSFTPGVLRALVLSNSWRLSAANNTGRETGTVTTNVWQVHSFVLSTNTGTPLFRHYVGGSLLGELTLGGAAYLSGLMLGANVSQAYGIRGEIAELLVYDSAIEAATRNDAEDYLLTKWSGVTVDTNAPPPVYVSTRLFVGGQEGYACYRIPAMVTTGKGTIIAMADGRISGCSDIPNPLDLVMKRSFDNGTTWTPLQVVVNYGSDTSPANVDTYPAYGITNPIARRCGGDAALLLDRTNGRVWVLYDNGAPYGGGRAIRLEMRYSDDDGATWSPAIDVEALNPGLRPPRSSGEFLCGPGNGIQLTSGPKAGRLIFPVYVYGSSSYSLTIYSDDHGETWQRGGTAGAGGGEIQVVETPAGGLLATLRDNNFSWSGVRTFNRSTDAGLTWGSPYYQTTAQGPLPDPACQASILRLTTTNDSNASRIVLANAAHASVRQSMTLRISYDEGQTWPVSNLVYAGSAAYSALTKLADGQIGLLVEVGNYSRIDFVRRSVDQVSNGKDSLPRYAVWTGEHFTPAQLLEPAVSASEADPDGDGANNYAEFVAGTDPLDPSSYLKLGIAPSAGGTNPPQLSFEAIGNTSYAIEHSTRPTGGSWEPYAEVPAYTTNRRVELTAEATNDMAFFRLTIPSTP